MMDWLTINLPVSGMQDFPVLLLLSIGFMVGTVGGFFGVGGGWIVTPALNIFGFPMSYAIGTGMAHIFGNSLVATRKHGLLGNVDWRLGSYSIIGSVAGIELGRQLILLLERSGHVDNVVRWVYMVFLIGLSAYMIKDYVAALHRAQKKAWPAKKDEPEKPVEPVEEVTPAALRIRRVKMPPYVSLPTSGITRISFWTLFVVFLASGFVSGFMGAGGGFILLPLLIYLIGCPTTVAVGTSLFAVAAMSTYGCFAYAMAGRTELYAALIMIVGAAVGSQIGVIATRYVRGYGIRLLFAIMMLLAGLSVALKQANSLLGIELFSTLAAWSVMGSAGWMTLLIIFRLIKGRRRKRPLI